jgi:hypothetical protein
LGRFIRTIKLANLFDRAKRGMKKRGTLGLNAQGDLSMVEGKHLAFGIKTLLRFLGSR